MRTQQRPGQRQQEPGQELTFRHLSTAKASPTRFHLNLAGLICSLIRSKTLTPGWMATPTRPIPDLCPLGWRSGGSSVPPTTTLIPQCFPWPKNDWPASVKATHRLGPGLTSEELELVQMNPEHQRRLYPSGGLPALGGESRRTTATPSAGTFLPRRPRRFWTA